MKVFEIDLNKKPYFVQSNYYPIKQNTLLPIAIEITDDIILGRTNTKIRKYQVNNFKTGVIKSLSQLPEKVYYLDDRHALHSETLVYSFNVNGRETAVFIYELFRQFLGYSEGICQYMFEYDMLDIFIDGQTSDSENNKRTITIELNNLLNSRLVRDDEFISSMISMLYDENLRRYWKEIQAHTQGNQNNFKFVTPPYDSVDINANVLSYSDFDLITSINDIRFQNELPFDKIIIKHPSLIEMPKSDGKKSKTGKREADIPKDIKFDNENNPPSNKMRTSITTKKPGFRFRNQIEVIREKSAYGSGRAENKVYTDFKLKDISLSMDRADRSGEAHELKINDITEEPSFDFTEIPKGLQHFCNAIVLVNKYLNLNFSYQILSFDKNLKSSFKYINGQERYGILVRLEANPIINLIEIDSSDNKFVSTLIYKDLTISLDEFIKNLLNDLAKSGGKWNKNFLNQVCKSETLRHPRKLAIEDNLETEEKSKILKTRIAKNLIKVLI